MNEDFLALAIGSGATPSNLCLTDLETVIERGQVTFIEVGRALMEIRDRRLYRETHTTFEAYCGERWGWTRQHANRQIAAARAVEEMEPMGSKPANERQARAMLDTKPQKLPVARRAAHTTRLPGVGRAQKVTASKIMDRIFGQMRGMTIALNSCDYASYEANTQELSDLTSCIRALVRLRKHLEEPDHDH